jgi:hypothetical protein
LRRHGAASAMRAAAIRPVHTCEWVTDLAPSARFALGWPMDTPGHPPDSRVYRIGDRMQHRLDGLAKSGAHLRFVRQGLSSTCYRPRGWRDRLPPLAVHEMADGAWLVDAMNGVLAASKRHGGDAHRVTRRTARDRFSKRSSMSWITCQTKVNSFRLSENQAAFRTLMRFASAGLRFRRAILRS